MVPHDDLPKINVLVACLWVLLGGYGGLMAYLIRATNAGTKPKLWNAVLEFNAAISVGTIVMLLCAAMDWSTLWTGVIVSSSGWIGAKSVVSILEAVLIKKLGLTRADIREKSDGTDE